MYNEALFVLPYSAAVRRTLYATIFSLYHAFWVSQLFPLLFSYFLQCMNLPCACAPPFTAFLSFFGRKFPLRIRHVRPKATVSCSRAGSWFPPAGLPGFHHIPGCKFSTDHHPFFRFVNVKKDINCTIPESGLKNSRWRGYSSHDSQKNAISSPGNASAKTLPPAETMPRSPLFQRSTGRNMHIDDLCHAFRAHMSGLFIAFREIHQLKLQSAQCKPCHLKKPSNHHDTKLPQIPYILRHSCSFQFKSIQESSQICSEIPFS